MASKASKKNKNETQGNILVFYGLQSVASSVLNDCSLAAAKISFKSATKSQVQYQCAPGLSGISDAQKQRIVKDMNELLSSNTSVSCTQFSGNAEQVPQGIDQNEQLYNIAINQQCLGVSHIPIAANNLGCLSEFKIIKCSYKANKNTLDIFYEFKGKMLDSATLSVEKEKNAALKGNNCYFEESKLDHADDRITFSKEIIEAILNELNIDKIETNTINRMMHKVHDSLNQYQNICYTKGYKAATANRSNH
mmetsp:Transcript_32073/g.51849  ORF Transcript_32073/g.51849 Transcript_32073/m.51849 type:complete len:251 (-) Transcript_32073:1224-1976(-)